jgi:hypothetical protein
MGPIIAYVTPTREGEGDDNVAQWFTERDFQPPSPGSLLEDKHI